ncbi:MAG: hypothetical protein AAFX04_08445 [Pseudomonadota bacterium]
MHSASIAVLSSLLLLSAPACAQDTGEQPPLDDFSDVEAERQAEAEPDIAPPEAGDDTAPQPDTVPGADEALARLATIVDQVDPEAKRTNNSWELTVGETTLIVVTDPAAGRMRIITPIAAVEDLPEGALMRLMQANFDTALDARYAIANNLVWGTFIHPLISLTDRDFASGLLQTKSLADTFGTTFSSGALSYGGGDSSAIIEDQLEQLLDELEKQDTI